MGFLDKMRNSFSKEESPEVPQEKSRIYQVTFEDPGPHAVTCPIRFESILLYSVRFPFALVSLASVNFEPIRLYSIRCDLLRFHLLQFALI